MQDGLYAVTFRTPQGTGSGVVVKDGSRLVGGDGGYAWRGWATVSGVDMSGSLEVFRHNAAWTNTIFASLEAYTLNYTGIIKGGCAKLVASSPQVPEALLQLELRFLGEGRRCLPKEATY
jgi:hypothetical protein